MDDFTLREFPMSNEDFWALSDIAYRQTGIVLGEHKKNLVYGRLSRRIRVLKIGSFADYIQLIRDGKHPEFNEFLNAITTNLTSFFREPHHFDFLREQLMPSFEKRDEVLLWSAGCSTGEEPYSIAMTLAANRKLSQKCKILATDLDSNVLKHARQGIYDDSRLEGLPLALVDQFFSRVDNAQSFKVADHLRSQITFNRLNLLGDWPIRKHFDVIFCRNVLIYFDKDTQKVLISRFVDQLKSGGYLIIGHSENIVRLNDQLRFLGKTIYQKLQVG